VILPKHLPIEAQSSTTPKTTEIPIGSTWKEIEREVIKRTLEACGGSRTETAKTLGISLRTLQYRLKEYEG